MCVLNSTCAKSAQVLYSIGIGGDMREDVTRLADLIAYCLDDALTAFSSQMDNHPVILAGEVEVYSGPQGWGDTTCGFGGYGGQMITGAQSVVVINDWNGNARVYHGGRFAYQVNRPNELFWRDLANWKLRGARAGWTVYDDGGA